MIQADPLFADALSGDLHLRSHSPCINTGNNAAVTAPPFLTNNYGVILIPPF